MRNSQHASRIWWFRLLALAIGLLPFFLCEFVLRLAGIPKQPAAVDPYVDLGLLRPLFEYDDATGQYQIAASRYNLFQPVSFAAEKSDRLFRVFALGGSTTQGEPYGTATAFPKWMELELQARMPDFQVEVINCGGLSYASYRVKVILSEVLAYQPDLVVVYTGHNEYLEERTYDGFRSRAGWFGLDSLQELHTVQWVRALVAGPAGRADPLVRSPTQMAAEVDALLDYQGGLEAYHREDAWRKSVPTHFAWNLREMVRLCRERPVPLVFVTPASNLRDCPPIKMEINPDLTDAQTEEFAKYWETAISEVDRLRAMEQTERALEIDPQHAGALFLLGTLQLIGRDYESAKENLSLARDHDVCPLRAPSELVEIFHAVASETETLVVDAQELFSALSDHEIVGNKWLVDHIHPSVEGHQRLAQAIVARCQQAGLIKTTNEAWQVERSVAYQSHLASLGEEYFHRAKQRLAGLMLWTQGRAQKVRPEP